MNKLFAIYLGGKAKGATLELHDIAFAVGPDIEATIPQLREVWFGTPSSLHIDSWVELTHADGYEISLRPEPAAASPKLFFLNIGSYVGDKFGESHHFHFLVCNDAGEAKRRGKSLVHETQPHADNLIELDDLHELSEVQGLHVHLTKSDGVKAFKFTNRYWPIAR